MISFNIAYIVSGLERDHNEECIDMQSGKGIVTKTLFQENCKIKYTVK